MKYLALPWMVGAALCGCSSVSEVDAPQGEVVSDGALPTHRPHDALVEAPSISTQPATAVVPVADATSGKSSLVPVSKGIFASVVPKRLERADEWVGLEARHIAASAYRRSDPVAAAKLFKAMIADESESARWKNYCVQYLSQICLDDPDEELVMAIIGYTAHGDALVRSVANYSLARLYDEIPRRPRMANFFHFIPVEDVLLKDIDTLGLDPSVRLGKIRGVGRCGFVRARSTLESMLHQDYGIGAHVAICHVLAKLGDAETFFVFEHMPRCIGSRRRAADRCLLTLARRFPNEVLGTGGQADARVAGAWQVVYQASARLHAPDEHGQPAEGHGSSLEFWKSMLSTAMAAKSWQNRRQAVRVLHGLTTLMSPATHKGETPCTCIEALLPTYLQRLGQCGVEAEAEQLSFLAESGVDTRVIALVVAAR